MEKRKVSLNAKEQLFTATHQVAESKGFGLVPLVQEPL